MRWRLALSALSAVAVSGLGGCFSNDEVIPCGTWAARDASGACVRRPWTAPNADEVPAGTSARSIFAVMDGRGRGLVGAASANGLEVIEEGAPGVFTSHRSGAAVGGSNLTDLTVDQAGNAVLAWSALTGSSQALYLSERDPDGAWREPSSEADAFSFAPTAYEPRAVVNGQGEWLLSWNQWRPTGHYGVAIAGRMAASEPWAFPADADDVLSMEIFFSNGPMIALNDSGQAIVTWYQSIGGPLRAWVSERSGPGVPFARVTPEDTLSPPESAVDSDPVASVKPAIAADGSAAVVWAGEDTHGSVVLYLATRDAAGAWTRPRDVDDVFSIPQGYARGVQIRFGPRGDLYVVWYQDAGDGDAVYAARRAPDGTWIEPGSTPIRLSSQGAFAIFPKLAVGPDGGVAVVWSERVGDGPFRVASRRTGGASEAWGPIEILSPETGEDALSPAIAMGPNDRAIAAWAQGPSDGARLMISRCE